MASDYALRHGLGRPACLGIAMAAMACAMALLAFQPTSAVLYIATTLVGLSFGAMNVLNPAICSEIFGLATLGAIYAAQSAALIIASYGFGTYLFAAGYDSHSNGACVLATGHDALSSVCSVEGTAQCPHGWPSIRGHKNLLPCCLGVKCIQGTCIISSGACVIASLLPFLADKYCYDS